MTNLIPLAYLQEVCFVSDNIPPQKFQVVLEIAQDDLRDILQQPLYDQILTQYSSTPTSFSTANASLYEYVKKYLAWQTNFYFEKFSNSDSTPTGRRTFKDDNSELLSDVMNFSYEKNIKERAVYYKNQLINFLKLARVNNSNAYPLWVDSNCETMDFAITAITGQSDIRTQIFKSTRYNE